MKVKYYELPIIQLYSVDDRQIKTSNNFLFHPAQFIAIPHISCCFLLTFPIAPKSTYENYITIKCIYIISVVTGATDGIGKEYARQVNDISNVEKIGRALDNAADDDSSVAVASARNSLAANQQ